MTTCSHSQTSAQFDIDLTAKGTVGQPHVPHGSDWSARTLEQGGNTDDDFNRVPKGRVEQARHRLAQL